MIWLGYALWIVGAIMALIGHIIVVVDAFQKEGALWGFLTLCIPIVGLYWIFAKYDKPNKKTIMIIYLGGIVLYMIGYFIFLAAAASMAEGMMEEMMKNYEVPSQ